MPNFRLLVSIIKKKYPKVADPLNSLHRWIQISLNFFQQYSWCTFHSQFSMNSLTGWHEVPIPVRLLVKSKASCVKPPPIALLQESDSHRMQPLAQDMLL